jgi:hypothetical protein
MSLRKGRLDVACMRNHVQSASKAIGRRRESEITNNKKHGERAHVYATRPTTSSNGLDELFSRG